MEKSVDYYLAPNSPWTYLGHERFVAIAKRHGATVNVKPIDLGRVFPASGGLPLKQRAPQRQAYRLVELARWSAALDRPLNAAPRFFPVAADRAARWIVAAPDSDAALALLTAITRAVWVEDADIADEATLVALARDAGLDAAALARIAAEATTTAQYDAFTQQAIEAGVFGVPWYVYRGEPFWGQDRLDFLDRQLAK